MNNINFEEGYKEFAINNDENRILRFNPTDLSLIDRIKTELNNIGEYVKSVDDEKDEFVKANKVDKEMRKKIDEMFYDGASQIIFADQNVLTTINGVTIFERFFKALLEIMRPYAEKEGRKSKEKIEKYRKQHDRIVTDNANN